MVRAAQTGALLGVLASSACSNIFGVGELTSSQEGTRDAGASTAAGSAGGGTSAGRVGAAGANTTAISGVPSTHSGGSSTSANSATGSPSSQGGSSFSSTDGGSGATPDQGGRTQDSFSFSGGVRSTLTPSTGGAGASDVPPSCQELAATCGASSFGSGDCCASKTVPGGRFFRSYDRVPAGDFDSTAWPAEISPFQLDVYEVTVGRFRQFVAAYPWRPAAGAGRNPSNPSDSGWRDEWNTQLLRDAVGLANALESCESPRNLQTDSSSTWTGEPEGQEELPINCVTWFEAFAFCAWDGGRLPTEAEWNYAAAGGDEARVYPWPSTLLTEVDMNHAVYQVPIAPVGSKPMGLGLLGQADLAGNVAEWNLDVYREPYGVPCNDCAELDSGSSNLVRVLRGGSYADQGQRLRSAERSSAPPNTRDPRYGFRCARDSLTNE
ncbi:MAG TPA: SUMF1/EgtB/PvdO family nonheme iron enzyme [Polyangiaceae bacterium]|nr:SUMF1/EgtB/PvdO family nonheme iron enzyme [Polyangiaceae bacterium]